MLICSTGPGVGFSISLRRMGMRSYQTPAHMFHWIKSGFEYWSQQEGDEVLPGPGLGDGFWCCATGRAVKSVVQRGRGAGHGQRLLTDGLLHLSPGVKPRCYNTGAILSRIQSTLCIDIGKEPRHTFFRNTKLMDSRKCISWRVTTLAVSTLKEIDFLNDSPVQQNRECLYSIIENLENSAEK